MKASLQRALMAQACRRDCVISILRVVVVVVLFELLLLPGESMKHVDTGNTPQVVVWLKGTAADRRAQRRRSRHAGRFGRCR